MTDWDDLWQKEQTPWDKGYPAPPLTEYLDGIGEELLHARRVLVPGCGSGHDVRELARRGVGATGLDLSETAIERARAHPPAGREDYICGSLFDAEWRIGREFDAVWEHTCFCAIDPSLRPAYARALSEILLPGGHLVGLFFLTPWDPGEEAQGPPFESTREEIVELLAPWFELRKDRVPGQAYPGREGREWLTVFERRNRPNPGVAESVPPA